MLMGDKTAERQITFFADGVVILKDSFHNVAETIEKQKLILLFPNKYKWTSTHLAGPNKHSQFLYQITPQGKGASVLTFTALHIEYDEKADAKLLAKQLMRRRCLRMEAFSDCDGRRPETYWGKLNKQPRQT